ncbi:tyrosine-protein phosphatase 69D-like isoform X2 [Eriocheir sinensis]|uniref:tyrosine-protein phosphatase 69D-like isoform X2 n=1 Tax=Eriocheir sinensis TaxID=95602 RepID=UPI0021C5E7C9|nr:tyrosine-protein phosphatase 69D-like isoform X2 [Eriocheir sinensis]
MMERVITVATMTKGLLPLLILLVAPLTHPSHGQVVREIAVESGSTEPLAGTNVTLSCKGRGDMLQWRHGHHNITPNEDRWHVEIESEPRNVIKSRLTILQVTLRDSGRYHCQLTKNSKDKVAEGNITLHVQASPVLREARNDTVRAGFKAKLSCTFSAAPAPEVHWLKGKDMLDKMKDYTITPKQESGLHLSDLVIENVTLKDNGTYKCLASNAVGPGDMPGEPILIVQDLPEVNLTLVRAIGTSQIQMEWAVLDNNSPIQLTKILIASGDSDFGEPSLLAGDQQDIILEDVGSAGEVVRIKILVANEVGETESEEETVTLLSEEPSFVPVASPKGSGLDSFTVGWSQPEDEETRALVGRYHLFLQQPESGDVQELFLSVPAVDHMFTNLKPATQYTFKVAACKDVFPEKEKDCGEYSEAVQGKTMNGVPGVISDLLVKCHQNPHTLANTVHIHWKPPHNPNGVIDRYKIELKASASYINEEGQRQFHNDEHQQNVAGSLRNFTFYGALPNTNYTVKVYAGIKRQYSSPMNAVCSMPVSTPISTPIKKWWRYHHNGRIVLRLPVPRVSERNGTICCHRVVVVKLETGASLQTLREPGNIPLSTYEEVHSSPSATGAYVAEAFSGWHIKDKYLLLGDGEVAGNWSWGCSQCLGSISPIGDPSAAHSTDNRATTVPPTRGNRRDLLSLQKVPPVVDGLLSSEANYTGFVIMSVEGKEGKVLTSYTDFFPIIQPKEEVTTYDPDPPPSITEMEIIYVAAGLFTFLLLLSFALCTLLCFYRRRNKHLEEEEVAESLSGSLGSLRRSHTLMSQPAVDVKPVPREELVPQYIEKLKDSELGFRREYEALPEKFYDRTSRASDMIENAPKNRYPDIKAYDQTRVKLSQINGAIGSDYINANYVLGYKERKKFICAQGPMETTVDDFWRMIVEQGCGVVVMLTNLEETGKVKCVKYWPEAGQPKTFGNVTIYLVKEKAYSDFMVRTLRAEWGGGEGEDLHTHEVCQYHYLLWKDFIAPEHPTGVLSFLRRINETYSQEQGSLLVHCSAGVGRTGTLVALDSLVMELDEEGQASIFNLICDLRHQRNFLVQSLKQYVFIHRALMEYSQFGNTELTINQLKELYSNHTHHDSVDDSSPLEKEFERLGKVVEDRKPFAIATSEENKPKNRYDYVLPYDSNRVILAPLSTRPSSTYINASFVTGYDLAESFIVTQDPMENTIADFWRMVFDQEVNTIVMLSEVRHEQLGSGEQCCNKYWPDDEETYEHISVKLVSSESYPKYSSRSFLLTNTKNSDVLTVTHFHYIGWSGLLGEVPLVTHGIMEIITRVQTHTDATLSSAAPTLVHCSGGGDRSSVYCCLNNCLRQLRREGRVDVFQTSRRIRALRQFQLQEFAQYEFCYKALVEFIDNKGLENL